MVLSRSLPTSRHGKSSNNSQRRNNQYRYRRANAGRYRNGENRGDMRECGGGFSIKLEEEDDHNNHNNNLRHRRHSYPKASVHKRSSQNRRRPPQQNRHHRQQRHRQNQQRNDNQSNHKDNKTLTKSLKPIHVSRSSIHSNWKKELGGIIRYYIHSISARGIRNESEIMKQLESMYVESGCDVEQTKNAILEQLGAIIPKSDVDDNDNNNRNQMDNQWKWVDIQMAIENTDEIMQTAQGGNQNNNNSTSSTTLQNSTQQPINDQILQSFIPSEDNKGILLKKEIKNGEGPAHFHEQWTNIIVPQWAIGKSYYFQLINKSPLDLSCEMTVDDHKIARNVPLPAHSHRMIRPDNARYFETHKWIIQPAQRLKLHQVIKNDTTGRVVGVKQEDNDNVQNVSNPPSQSQQRIGKRYNSIRPNYNNQRVNTTNYPDPIVYGWTFTGSCEQSKVEFYEKNMNLGFIKLDFYYTTATVKTTLVHPTMGANSLFRNTVTSELYVQILQNPRSHTNRGYRHSTDRPDDVIDIAMMDDSNEIDQDESGKEAQRDDNGDIPMDESNENNQNENTSYPQYARNDDYDFDNEGHANRATAMSKLETTNAYSAWEDAARKEWACIHAKFYISLPKKRNPYKSNDGDVRKGRGKRNEKQEDLPEQAPIVDVKAAEKATLGTKFHAVGPSAPRKRTTITMKRINGLNDQDEYRAAPLFEYKLYYRAEEEVINEEIMIDEENNIMEENEEKDAEEGKSETPLSHQLLNVNSVAEYKKEKIHQITKWHKTSAFQDEDEANFVLENRVSFVNAAESVEIIDSIVQEYYQWFQKQQWSR